MPADPLTPLTDLGVKINIGGSIAPVDVQERAAVSRHPCLHVCTWMLLLLIDNFSDIDLPEAMKQLCEFSQANLVSLDFKYHARRDTGKRPAVL